MKANPNTEDFSIVKNENAIKQAMKNLLLTQFGERPFQPKTGSRVKSMLFENFDVFMIEVSLLSSYEVQAFLTYLSHYQ